MKSIFRASVLFPSQIAVALLAASIANPVSAQDAQPSATRPVPAASSAAAPAKEGFWGRVNPFARKKWVNDRTAPLKGQLNELDEVNAKNARDIKDVDGRAQAGINKAQSAADAANQAALAAGVQAQKAGATAQDAAGRMDKLNATIGGMDQYRQISEVDVPFHGIQPILSEAARKQLDTLAASLTGHQGYILEVEAHAPGAGSIGIQNSERLAEAVKRYLVSEHQIPVYRMHSVALGNAAAGNEAEAKPVKASSVHIRLMENTLASR
jgi:outer membrane protein OmpA-like peptidoglycan-associated protein